MKRSWKGVLAAICAGLILIAVCVCAWVYLVWYMTTDILLSAPEDGAWRVTVQRVGEPESNIFFFEHLRISVERADGELLDRKELFISTAGKASFRADDCQVNWYPAGVEIRFEQPVYRYSSDYSSGVSLDDLFYILGWSKPLGWLAPPLQESDAWIVPFAGSEGFPGYTAAQALEVIQERYGGEIRFVDEEEDRFTFSVGGAEFHAVNDVPLTDDFWKCYTEHWAGDFSAAHNRRVTLQSLGNPESGYVLVLTFNGRYGSEVESFTRAACDLIELYMEDSYLSPEGKMPVQLSYFVDGKEQVITLSAFAKEYDRDIFYNKIYTNVEENSLRVYESKAQIKEQDEQVEDNEWSMLWKGVELTDEIWERYLSIEPECTYVRSDGMELRMIGIDRALGSSYYVLIAVSGDGSEYELVTWNPHAGHGGQAMWLDFPENDRIGFSCLSYSGGSYGMLFRTEDGGETFVECAYPSANVELPNGELYNPFVMPEKVFVEGSVYYLLAGQGPDGDYYGEEGYCKGLYWSSDQGKTWKYVGEVPGVDIYLSELYED